nr:hypothetical protein CFP56_58986 [Quercus suber]
MPPAVVEEFCLVGYRWFYSGLLSMVLSAKGQKAIDTALKADLVILNTAVLKEKVPHVLPKVLWWIHEMRGHYFKVEYVKHLPFVAGAMIDSLTTAEYWKNRTRECLGIKMPETYVVHGNSKELMESLGVRNEDLIFAIINSATNSCTPYLASIDVLVQNSQARGECFGRITTEAMAFQLPVLADEFQLK